MMRLILRTSKSNEWRAPIDRPLTSWWSQGGFSQSIQERCEEYLFHYFNFYFLSCALPNAMAGTGSAAYSPDPEYNHTWAGFPPTAVSRRGSPFARQGRTPLLLSIPHFQALRCLEGDRLHCSGPCCCHLQSATVRVPD